MNITEYKKTIRKPLRQSTLCFLIRDNKVLLALKKRGFGKGRWNGVGGKPGQDEKIEETAVRETQEEIGVIPLNIEKRAVLDFYFPHNPEWNQQVIIYLAKNWTGKPMESEEMKPRWFNKNDLPFELMWPDDKHWLPKVLEGSNINAEFLFGENDTLLNFNVAEI